MDELNKLVNSIKLNLEKVKTEIEKVIKNPIVNEKTKLKLQKELDKYPNMDPFRVIKILKEIQ